MSRLLDEALDLGEAGGREWLAALGPEHQDIVEALREALSLGSIGTGQALSTLPKVGADGDADRGTESGLEAGARVGPYELIRPLGAGGMAEVWLARRADGAIKREVALKLPLLTRLRRDLEPRFAREREILGGLSHPNIARLYDAGFAQDGQPYIALEYVVGTTLTEYCDQQRLTIRGRLGLFRQVLSAVQYAHTHLVIHRDLKPSNVLVTEAGQVRLLDFGIAKLLSEGEAKETELTQLSGRSFTPDYAAPEQIAGAPITTAADVYALGVMLYEILTGQRPYRLKRDTRAALEEAILQADPIPASRAALNGVGAVERGTTTKKLSRALKGDLDVITLKSLKKSTRERYQTASALDEDLARFLDGEVVLAQPDSIAYRAGKFARRHWVAIAVVSVLILTLAGGLVSTSYESTVASAQRDLALQAQLRALTQTAAARLKDGDISGALGIILEVLPHPDVERSYTPEALSVFQEARTADAQILMLAGHTDSVKSARYSRDGTRIATASRDKTARIWDADTGQEILRIVGHNAQVNCASFSPDGQHIVTASYDRTARIWDTKTARQIGLLSGHTDRLTAAAYSPDGRRIVTASADQTARIWDAATGQQLALLTGHTALVAAASFSPDGKQVLTASYDKTARIWDAVTGRQIKVLSGHTNQVWDAEYSHDGARVVTASWDKTARVWDVATGRQVLILRGHTDLVAAAAFSPDDAQIATASFDRTARIWDPLTGQQSKLLSGHEGSLLSVGFSPDRTRIITAAVDKTARTWEAGSYAQMKVLSGHTDYVNSAAFSRDGRRVVTASLDRTARIWDAASGREILKLLGHTDVVGNAAFSPDGNLVVTTSLDRTARLWNATTGDLILQLIGHSEPVWSAAFSPDGTRVVTASIDKTARIWDVRTGRTIETLAGHTDRVNSALFSPDGKTVVTAGHDETARIWDAATGQQIRSILGHTDKLQWAAFSPDGARIATASRDKTARVWDAATGQQLVLLIGHTDIVQTVEFSPDAKRIATASLDRTARIWDAATGQQLLVLDGHADLVDSAAFSPDGERLVTASDDGTARIWDARSLPLDLQIRWAAASQFDPLSSTQRFQLGLPAVANVKQWPTTRSECDMLAAAPYDPDRRAQGVMVDQIVGNVALAACAATKLRRSADQRGRSLYQQSRARVASGNLPLAQRDLKEALAAGYRVANVDLAMLWSNPTAGMLDVPNAIAAFERAWRDGVTIAAFELGSLSEQGVSRLGGHGDYLLTPDSARAWYWYGKGAAAGQPNALARFAERQESAALLEQDAARRASYLLEAFKYYAAAAERARIEDWPDDAWRNWRYRRASLARLLARTGMMQEIAEVYQEVRTRYATHSGTVSNRLESLFHHDGNE